MKCKKKQIYIKRSLLQFFYIVLCAGIFVTIQYVYVHGAVLGYQTLFKNAARGNILCQLYFGGLFLENSMDSFVLMCSFGAFLIEVLLLNGKVIGEWFQNLELMLYRTEHRSSLLCNLIRQVSFRNMGLIFCSMCLIEGIISEPEWIYGLFIHFLLLEMFALCIILGYLFFHNELVYMIVGMVYYVPAVLLGFWYEKGNELWKTGRYFLMLRGNWNYYVPISTAGNEEITLNHMEIFTNVNKWENILLIVMLMLLLYFACERALKFFETI